MSFFSVCTLVAKNIVEMSPERDIIPNTQGRLILASILFHLRALQYILTPALGSLFFTWTESDKICIYVFVNDVKARMGFER